MKLVSTDAKTGELFVMCSTCGGECCGQCDRFTEPPYDGCPTCERIKAADEAEHKMEARREEQFLNEEARRKGTR